MPIKRSGIVRLQKNYSRCFAVAPWPGVGYDPLRARRRQSALQRRASLFDHLVGGCEQCLRYRETEPLGGLEVNHQFELGRLQYWKIGRFIALKNARRIDARLAIIFDAAATVTQQPTGQRKLSGIIDR